jgi:hypothetical protein
MRHEITSDAVVGVVKQDSHGVPSRLQFTSLIVVCPEDKAGQSRVDRVGNRSQEIAAKSALPEQILRLRSNLESVKMGFVDSLFRTAMP